MEPQPTPPMPRVFISYRRGDDDGYARLLDKTLSEHFGDQNVFRDISDLRSGTLWDETIDDEINTCDFLLAVIGKRWLEITKERAAKNLEDFARMEIATALRLRPRVTVIPVVPEGVEVPPKEDLPNDLKDLVRHQAFVLSDRWWKAATDQLIKEIKEEFAKRNPTAAAFYATPPIPKVDLPAAEPVPTKPTLRNSRLSFYCGSAAGLLSGAFVGVIYTATTNVPWWRPLIVAAYAAAVGAIVSGTINLGMKRVSGLLNNSPWSKLIGSTLGGTVGGIAAAILSMFVFGWLSGPVVEPLWIAVAGLVSNFAVAIGILTPELRQGGEKRLFTIVVLIIVSAVIGFVANWLVNEHQEFLKAVLAGSDPLSLKMWLFGAVVGALLGIQVGVPVFFSEQS